MTLTIQEHRQALYNALDAFHSIHFAVGDFSPSSVVIRPAAPSSSDSKTPADAPRKVTLAGFAKAEWHLCPGAESCQELLNAKKALGLDEAAEKGKAAL
jgi:hypothetical protein